MLPLFLLFFVVVVFCFLSYEHLLSLRHAPFGKLLIGVVRLIVGCQLALVSDFFLLCMYARVRVDKED